MTTPARIRAAFLLLPKRINGEWRCFCRARWLEVYYDGWEAVEWLSWDA